MKKFTVLFLVLIISIFTSKSADSGPSQELANIEAFQLVKDRMGNPGLMYELFNTNERADTIFLCDFLEIAEGKDGDTLIHTAIKKLKNALYVLHELLECAKRQNVNLNKLFNAKGKTPLALAVDYNLLDAINFLFAKNTTFKKSRTPFDKLAPLIDLVSNLQDTLSNQLPKSRPIHSKRKRPILSSPFQQKSTPEDELSESTRSLSVTTEGQGTPFSPASVIDINKDKERSESAASTGKPRRSIWERLKRKSQPSPASESTDSPIPFQPKGYVNPLYDPKLETSPSRPKPMRRSSNSSLYQPSTSVQPSPKRTFSQEQLLEEAKQDAAQWIEEFEEGQEMEGISRAPHVLNLEEEEEGARGEDPMYEYQFLPQDE